MTRPRFITPTSTALTLIVSLMLGGVYQAAVSVVDNSGHTLTVEVVYDPGDPSVQGVAMVDQPPSGSASTDTIFSTWDRLFGTYIANDSATAIETGLPGFDVLTLPRALVLPLQRTAA